MFGLRTYLAFAVLALVVVVGCQTAPPADSSQSIADASAATGGAVSATDATPETAVEPTPDIPPTPVSTPTPRPTPRPLPTPVPPTQALEPAATALETKLGAFRSAVKTQDVSGSLRLQRELLSAATDAETALKNDKSPQAQGVRSAIALIRAGIAGDSNGLDHAETALRQVLGGSAAGVGATLTSENPNTQVGDLHTLIMDVHDFRQAVQGRNSGDALRLQGKLLVEIGAVLDAQKAPGNNSPDATAIKDALGALQKGLDGDSTALATAAAALDKLDPGATQQDKAAIDYAGLAASLAAKMDAFQTATSTASQGDLLRLQQEILTEAAQDETALANDQSPQASALRDAIRGVRTGVSGDLTKVDSARTDLGKISGQAAAPGASTASKPINDIKGFARDLDSTVASFQDALQKNDTASILRLQKSLADQADQAEASLKSVSSKPATQVLTAVSAIRAGFAGDTSKLADARVQLRAVSGAGATPGSVATKPGSTPLPGGADTDMAARAVGDKLTILNDALHDPKQTEDEITKRRDALNAEALKAEQALKGVNDPRAERLRQAFTVAREAAAGDNAKLQNAMSALQAAMNSP